MDGACFSGKFLAWVARAGWVTSRFDDDGEFDDEGNNAIWREDAEGRTATSYLLHAEADDWFGVTDGDTGRAMFAALGLARVERYFWGALAGAIREKIGLPELVAPARPAAGYRIGDGLVDASGAVLARGEEQCLVALSHCLAPTLDALEAALLHPEGKPLFATKG